MTRSSDRTLLQALGFNDPDKGNEEHDLGCRYLTQPEPMAKLVELIWPKSKVDSPFYDTDTVKHSNTRVVGTKHAGEVEAIIQRHGHSGAYHIGFLDAEITPTWLIGASAHRRRRPTDEEVTAEVGAKPDTGHYVNDYDQKTKRQVSVRWFPGTSRAATPQEAVELDAKYSAWYDRQKAAHDRWIDLGLSEVIGEVWQSNSTYSRVTLGIEVKIGHVPVGQAIRQIKLYASYRPTVAQWVLATRHPISKDDRESLTSEGIFHIRLAGGFDAYLEQLKQAPEADSPEL